MRSAVSAAGAPRLATVSRVFWSAVAAARLRSSSLRLSRSKARRAALALLRRVSAPVTACWRSARLSAAASKRWRACAAASAARVRSAAGGSGLIGVLSASGNVVRSGPPAVAVWRCRPVTVGCRWLAARRPVPASGSWRAVRRCGGRRVVRCGPSRRAAGFRRGPRSCPGGAVEVGVLLPACSWRDWRRELLVCGGDMACVVPGGDGLTGCCRPGTVARVSGGLASVRPSRRAGVVQRYVGGLERVGGGGDDLAAVTASAPSARSRPSQAARSAFRLSSSAVRFAGRC